ncbi:hypothetical protein RF11_06845 [Thelohanellus kitauei]|uniref:Integrase catalytic domain-containing protein n=1 Tax=Thelohanellus kitauei TaxID=669202 RepID=A0A0C2N5J2_THEKT|nr:hypothetical protein RF11_06845 [Thelohanellus kitauei]
MYVESMVLWNDKIIIPDSLRDNILNHLKQWDPGMESMLNVEKLVRRCYECQSHQPQLPETPSDREANTIFTTKKLYELFARCGIPKILLKDNGPQFTSEEIANFYRMYNLSHARKTPYHSRCNGAAERAIGSIKDNRADERKDVEIQFRQYYAKCEVKRILLQRHDKPNTTIEAADLENLRQGKTKRHRKMNRRIIVYTGCNIMRKNADHLNSRFTDSSLKENTNSQEDQELKKIDKGQKPIAHPYDTYVQELEDIRKNIGGIVLYTCT